MTTLSEELTRGFARARAAQADRTSRTRVPLATMIARLIVGAYALAAPFRSAVLQTAGLVLIVAAAFRFNVTAGIAVAGLALWLFDWMLSDGPQ